MTTSFRPLAIASLCLSTAFLTLALSPLAAQEIPPIERILPPKGEAPSRTDRQALEKELEFLEKRLSTVADHERAADVAALVKAVRFALQFDEFYGKGDVDKAKKLLALAKERLVALQKNQTPWMKEKGTGVFAYRSSIDDSPQPYGVEIPDDLPESGIPLYVFLHGRGDKETDLHFIANRLAKKGQIQPPGSIVIHPFGRQCIGFKSAGEIDVLEAVDDVCKRFPIDRDKIVLIGFSMGGAGVWHVAAHYPNQWVAASPGAGFAETARYQNLTPEKYPPLYEQRLWGAYDVPGYVRNLFGLPVFAYSGEKDKQIQAARVMEEAYKAEGEELTHLIGPGVEHKYEPATLAELLMRLEEAARRGKDRSPQQAELQTRTLRYPTADWLTATALDEHWQDSRISAEITATGVDVATKNVKAFRIERDAPIPERENAVAVIDGQNVDLRRRGRADAPRGVFVRRDGIWHEAAEGSVDGPMMDVSIEKSPRLHGPIDDAFLSRFIVVLPEGESSNETLQKWVDFEIAHFLDRWRATFRGEPIVVKGSELTPEQMTSANLILWGDPESSRAIQKIVEKLPIEWTASTIAIGASKFDAATHAPALIYPNPFAPNRYVVINSGPTFREAHDKTNSQQNPKLPDWAIFDLTTPPSGSSAGRVVAADFFDESWQPKPGPPLSAQK
ncbi:MAG TPA: alpha/beta hydrolase-fold protein [Pirellulaceae bacterium]|jgi:predicted esterase|nr:alpha/beta hydrolase-fold protein [Pirellulaceae bacterium]